MARRNDEQANEQGRETRPRARIRLGLRGKMVLFLVAALIPLAAITWYVSARSLRTSMAAEFSSKGEAIASSLATSGVDLISTRDASSVQSLVDEFAKIRGVAYVLVYDPQKTLIAHTFSPVVPAGIVDKNPVPGNVARQVREIEYQDPARRATRQITDIGMPMAGGKIGTVRVGMDRAIINEAATAAGRELLLLFGGVATLVLIGGALLADRIARPVTQLVQAAQRVGQGDLSETVPVRSRDEIGALGQAFNEAIVRLRSQVQTESERDDERRRREELQENIIKFLDTAMEVSQGDLTKRGEVTSDVLGNVVDAINLMVAEIAAIIAEVRVAAMQVSVSANQMSGSTGRMAQGVQDQAREAARVASAVSALTQLVRQVAESAQSAAGCRPSRRRSRAWAIAPWRSRRSSTPSRTSPPRPTSWPSTPPSRPRERVRRGCALPWSPKRWASSRSARPRRRRTSPSSSRTSRRTPRKPWWSWSRGRRKWSRATG